MEDSMNDEVQGEVKKKKGKKYRGASRNSSSNYQKVKSKLPLRDQAKNTVFRLLARREYSRHELSTKLEQKYKSEGLQGEVISEILNDFRENGYQCDERFCESFVRSKLMSGFGENRIKQDCSQKGVDKELVNSQIDKQLLKIKMESVLEFDAGSVNAAQIDDPDATADMWIDQAFDIWLRKFKQYSADYKIQAKQKRFLAYRGYSFDTINKVMVKASHIEDA